MDILKQKVITAYVSVFLLWLKGDTKHARDMHTTLSGRNEMKSPMVYDFYKKATNVLICSIIKYKI